MRKTLKEVRATNKNRQKAWREEFKKSGGKLVQIPFDKEGVERLNRLRKENKKYSLGKLMGLALIILEDVINEDKKKKEKEKSVPSHKQKA